MRRSREDIVITGMSCRFAGAATLEAFWRNIMRQNALFTPLPLSATSPADEYPSNISIFDRPLPLYAAQLGEFFACKPADQYFPRKINAGENQDLFFAVQLAIDALRDSGNTINNLTTDRISLRLGYAPPFNSASVNWLQHTLFVDQTLSVIKSILPNATTEQLHEIRHKISTSLPEPNPHAFLSAMGSVMASWIAHLLGIAGPAFVIDSGAASGHQTLQGAMDDLLSRRSDIALAGAIQPPLSLPFLHGLSGTFSFSRDKQLIPFHRNVDGTLPGEGGAFFVLKRLKDAKRANDRIYALIRSTGIAAAALDQHQRVPTPERLSRAIMRAIHLADVTPDSIQLVEAHGSGVPHSDKTELQVLQELFEVASPTTPKTGYGSVKGNIGHTFWACGAAGILKSALAISHRVLPPQVAVEKPLVKNSTPSSIYLLDEVRPWIRGSKKHPRRACVSAIDFTGTCAAAILEEYPEAE